MNAGQQPPRRTKREIFLGALEHPTPAARAAYLDGACGKDAALRASVEDLLQNVEQDSFLESPAIDTPGLAAAGIGPGGTIIMGVVSEKPGDKIGRYKLLQQIGEGGCGVVYMADQEEPVKRRVALKVIKPGMDTKEVLGRFEAERQALALMDHPNIAKVLDAGATENGRPFFVMELVKGIPITRYCDENKLKTAQRLELFIQVCQAIQHAHQKGIIHRDIKPSNILVADHDGVPVPKIIDFGIAKATTGQKLTDKTVFTALEQFIGTPAYMSPEQANLSGLDIDTRSDIYSLGVLLYELLTGKTPFDARRLFEAGFDEIRRIIREEEPQRPSRKLSTLAAGEQTTAANARQTDSPRLIHLVRGDLDWIVMKCLEKDRNRRYETANGLALDLERHVKNEPVLARPPSQAYRFQKMVRRNKLVFAAGTAVAAALLAGFTVSTCLFIKEKTAEQEQSEMRKEAEAQSKKAKSEREKAEAAAAEITRNMAASEFSMAVRLIAEEHKDDALAYLARSLSLNPTNEAAATRLATLLASQSWWVPVETLNPGGRVLSGRFSSDGKRIFAKYWNAVRVWDVQTGRPLNELLKFDANVHPTQLSPDAKRVVTMLPTNAVQVWNVETGQPLSGLMKHDDQVMSALFSPDGNQIVTASRDKTARVWDAQSGQPLTGPLKHNLAVMSAEFSPDGKRIVTAGREGTVRVWDALTGQPLTEPMKHAFDMYLAHFSPDGNRIVSVSDDHTAQVWDSHSGKMVAGPLKHDGWVDSAEFSPDGTRIVTAAGEGMARVWDAQSGQMVAEPLKHGVEVTSAHFSPDGKRIITTSADFSVKVWDVQSGQPLAEPLKHSRNVNWAQFSPDGRQIVTASGNGIQVWDELGGPSLAERLNHSEFVNSAQFSPDGKRIVTCSGVRSAGRVWDAQTGRPLTKLFENEPLMELQEEFSHGVQIPISSMAVFSPDGKRVVMPSLFNTALVWDAQSGEAVAGPLKHKDRINSALFSPDGKRIVTASKDHTARVWDAETGQPLAEPLQHGGFVNSAQFSPDGKKIVTASWDHTARVWDAQTGKPLAEPLTNGAGMLSAQFSPDGKRILTISGDTVQLWDAQTGKLRAQLSKTVGWVNSALFSPDGTRIVTTSDDHTARVWDAQSGQPVTEPLKHNGKLYSAQFSPDGTRIVTASDDHTARVWDAQSGQPLTEPLQHSTNSQTDVVSAQFSPDGKRVVSASLDTTARVWDISPSPANHPAWLSQLAEVISGKVLSKEGLLEPTRLDRGETVNQIRQILSQESDDDDWVHWGRWFLADQSTRTISPFSKLTIPEYIDMRIEQNYAASLLEANRLAAGNRELTDRINQAQSKLEQSSRAIAIEKEAEELEGEGKQAEAEAKYHQAAEQRDFTVFYRESAERGDSTAQNGLAWLLATCPNKYVRDGAKAVSYAEKAVTATQRKNGLFLDTLAAAYAETGQFDKAVAVEQEAIGVLQNGAYKEDFASHLKLYQRNKPCREPLSP